MSDGHSRRTSPSFSPCDSHAGGFLNLPLAVSQQRPLLPPFSPENSLFLRHRRTSPHQPNNPNSVAPKQPHQTTPLSPANQPSNSYQTTTKRTSNSSLDRWKSDSNSRPTTTSKRPSLLRRTATKMKHQTNLLAPLFSMNAGRKQPHQTTHQLVRCLPHVGFTSSVNNSNQRPSASQQLKIFLKGLNMILNGCSLSFGGICKPYKACRSKSCRSAQSCIPLLPSKVLVACARHSPSPH